ncbi:FecCD family ABC transporter permease [Megasphaera stantonii]|uniref:Iron ABC transporter permease n=1 Tax=Megasphaera stantonii TaxID=2144175 RepID=A0A346AWH9_9FIRM|nr:iron ABC transporter permease [Megasphaera stantonii]AXL20222.1 iron ABC transporter permease [Megasphaera stantonii]
MIRPRNRLAWRWFMLVVFAAAALIGIVASVAQGAAVIPPSQVLSILWNPTAQTADQIVWNLRLPRALTGAMVGSNLAVAGAILQAVMRNPLADPHIIGISAGAGITGIVVLVLFPAMTYLMTPVAFLGAMAAAGAIYALAWKNGIKPVRIILAGVAVSAFLSAGISGILVFYSDRVHGALLWMVGGFSAASWNEAAVVAPYWCAGLLLALIGAYYLNVLQLGDDMARALGLNIELARVLLTAVAALLAASSVSVAGLLGFVGLVVPHMVRLLVGTNYSYIIPGSALLGMAVVTLSDTLARVIFAPVELPAGLIMAFIGAPFFLFLLRKEV